MRPDRPVRPSREPEISLVARLREKNPLPAGATPVAMGLVVNGATIFLFFPLANWALDDASASALSTLWSLLFGLGNGAMQPLEQEVTRAISVRRAAGAGAGPVVRRAAVIGGAFTLVLCLGILASWSTVEDRLFSGSGSLVLALMLGLVGFAVGHLTRGALSSHGYFRAYAVFFGGEGVARLLLCGILAVAGVHVIGPWGLVLGVSPLVAAAVALRGKHGLLAPGPEAEWSELTSNLGWLVLGTGSLALLLNSGTVVVQWLAQDQGQEGAAATFLAGLTLARMPLFLFQAVVASLLPKLSRLASEGRIDEFRAGLRTLVIAILGGGAVVTVVAATVGPWAMSIYKRGDSPLSSRDLGFLAAGSILVMAAVSLDQALIALDGHRRMAIGWFAALVTFAVTVLLGHDLFFRVELGLGLAGAVALAWMAVSLDGQLRRHRPAHDLEVTETAAELTT